MKLTEERIHALLEAVPQSERGPDGMPTEIAIRAIAERIADQASPDELREAAVQRIVRLAEIHFEMQVKMGAAERFRDAETGEVRYRKLRDTTAAEETEIDAALDEALAKA
jgi:hypothetical protein